MSTSEKILKIARYVMWFAGILSAMALFAHWELLEDSIKQAMERASGYQSVNEIMLAVIYLLRASAIYDIGVFVASGLTTMGTMAWRYFYP